MKGKLIKNYIFGIIMGIFIGFLAFNNPLTFTVIGPGIFLTYILINWNESSVK